MDLCYAEGSTMHGYGASKGGLIYPEICLCVKVPWIPGCAEMECKNLSILR